MFDYCERLSTAFWAEPVNALSNIFFLIAAYLAYKILRRLTLDTTIPAWILIINLSIIGIGSFMWHTFATPWAELADVIPITIFLHLYLLFFSRYVIGYNYLYSALFVGVFFVFNILFGKLVNPGLLNGSVMYAPALIFLFIMAIFIRNKPSIKPFLIAIGVFLVSITFRSIDFIVCDFISIGTHSMWHFLNAVLLFMLVKIMIQEQERKG